MSTIVDKLSWKEPIKSEGNKYYELISLKPYEIAELCPDKVQRVDLLSGHWGAPGSIILWTYLEGGKEKHTKERVESVDHLTRRITFKVLEGALLDNYKSFKSHLHVETSICGTHTKVNWCLEYVKKCEHGPDPIIHRDLMIALTKEIDKKLHLLLVCN